MSNDKSLTGSVRMFLRECSCENAGAAGYAEAFTTVLSGKQTSEPVRDLSLLIRILFLSMKQQHTDPHSHRLMDQINPKTPRSQFGKHRNPDRKHILELLAFLQDRKKEITG